MLLKSAKDYGAFEEIILKYAPTCGAFKWVDDLKTLALSIALVALTGVSHITLASTMSAEFINFLQTISAITLSPTASHIDPLPPWPPCTLTPFIVPVFIVPTQRPRIRAFTLFFPQVTRFEVSVNHSWITKGHFWPVVVRNELSENDSVFEEHHRIESRVTGSEVLEVVEVSVNDSLTVGISVRNNDVANPREQLHFLQISQPGKRARRSEASNDLSSSRVLVSPVHVSNSSDH